jgi:hypothetical protein
MSRSKLTIKHEILYDCHSLCYNVSFERDIVSNVLLFVRLIVVFSSHMDVKVHATHGLYNVLVQLASDAFIYLCCANCVFKVTRYMSPTVSYVEAYKSLLGPCVHGHVVYAYDVSPVLALFRRRVTTSTSVTRYDLDKRYTAVAVRPSQVYCQPYNISC